MRAAGIVRRLDNLGRVTLPIELRRSLDWKEQQRIEILAEEDRVILRRYEPNCCLCGGGGELRDFRGKLICGKCLRDLRDLR